MRVLVCDDDQEVGDFLRTLFDLEGWDSELVTSGEDCLAWVRDHETPGALVLDQVMPGLTGIETASRLRADGFDAPIILCSGHLGPEMTADIEALGLTPCNKIDMQALVRVVRAATVGGSASRRRRAQKPG
jgi:CheY-like chemotaxis protein